MGGHHRGRGWRVEKERLLQACGRLEHEAEEEASSASQEGCQPIYQGALRLQGEAGLQDCACPSYEEAQGDGELICCFLADSFSRSRSGSGYVGGLTTRPSGAFVHKQRSPSV